jgi:predicted dehydrogenase
VSLQDQEHHSLRIGILGAARICGLSIVEPAHILGHRLVAVAARSPERAAAFAQEHRVERVVATYDDLINDPEIDVVYNPLPNGLHGRWNIAAARAGKHVLAEKPSAANAAEARAVKDAVEAAGVVFMEAFHYPYHPLFERISALLEEGFVGEIEHIEALLRMPAPPDSDPRWDLSLAGGSTMDLGCYSLSCLRLLGRYAGGSPTVAAARADERPGHPGVDERLLVDVAYPSGAIGNGGSDMDFEGRDFHLTIRGTEGELHAPSFAVPSEDDRLFLRPADGPETVEHLGLRSSYVSQLEVFADAVLRGGPVLTDAAWSVGNMEMIDTAYDMAGLAPRNPAGG